MKYYLAPLEGITGYVYRNSYAKYFNNIDKYFTPFIVPTSGKNLSNKDLRDVLPQNNKGLNIVPQILTNDSNGFISTCTKLQQLDYIEVNLNLGCPSGTVVSKNKGSGFLAKTEELDQFLYEIFEKNIMKISVKTRIGKDNPEEIYRLMEIYNKYPIDELIVHPRTQKDFYKNKPNWDIFENVLSLSTNPVGYNGDIFTVDDYNKLMEKFSDLKTVMLGRGIVANPGLMNLIKNNSYLDKSVLKDFHDEILNKYIGLFNEDRNAMFRMKELWWYMIYIFSDNKKYAKRIKKSQNLRDYSDAVSSLFVEQEIIDGAGLFHES